MSKWNNIIPERFEKEIVLHAMRIISANIQDAPLILGIDGPPGEGKTYQCKLVLKRLGIKVFPLSAGQFENKEAGEPAELIRNTYREACGHVKSSDGNMSAIVIDDADVAFGNWGEMYQYTINTQTVIGELMRLADRHIEESEEFLRIPIFMTGNDLSKIYSPLRREGRMNFYYWEPNLEEKVKMVYFLFDYLDENECKELVEYVENLRIKNHMNRIPIAFYSDLESHQYDDTIWNLYLKSKRTYFGSDIVSKIRISDQDVNSSLVKLKEIAKEKLIQIKLSEMNHIGKKRFEKREKYGNYADDN
ncbi:hypothetical protein B5F53_18480 [Blautia sp. An249]|uniref:AAA family ATPase n=1 Tax=Blautia sp. An249 TaxID=1965603 RepID=UPI000B36EB5C|nr:AAA family ATPase [Blautia sp. An249]OUO75177.1 hypothetical protein B5F53_18480 [Blautia sp. An249]